MKVQSTLLKKVLPMVELALPSQAVIPITEFVLMDAKHQRIIAVTDVAAYSESLEMDGLDQVLLHKSTFRFISSIPDGVDIEITPGQVKWAGGLMTAPSAPAGDYPAYKGSESFIPVDNLMQAMALVTPFIDSKISDIDLFASAWVIDGCMYAGTHHCMASAPCECPDMGIGRDHLHRLSKWMKHADELTADIKDGWINFYSVTQGILFSIPNAVGTPPKFGDVFAARTKLHGIAVEIHAPGILSATRRVLNSLTGITNIRYALDPVSCKVSASSPMGAYVEEEWADYSEQQVSFSVPGKDFLMLMERSEEMKVAEFKAGDFTGNIVIFNGDGFQGLITSIKE